MASNINMISSAQADVGLNNPLDNKELVVDAGVNATDSKDFQLAKKQLAEQVAKVSSEMQNVANEKPTKIDEKRLKMNREIMNNFMKQMTHSLSRFGNDMVRQMNELHEEDERVMNRHNKD